MAVANPARQMERNTQSASERRDIEVTEFLEFTHPLDDKCRCYYRKLYAGVGGAYRERAIDIYDKTKGTIIVLRPGSHVAIVTEYSVGGFKEVDDYFGSFMIDQSQNVLPEKNDDDANQFEGLGLEIKIMHKSGIFQTLRNH
ncbi:hypothetical protein Cantr_07920 [Candida viswanathii]|uniref:Phenol hydroxylase-like C-terminal dimerisation domain-containing protein n=1 Tax=Candida viswanathii TaxID=5486 RepID=A0A367Y2G3_9ASCO|nr:hypothetical protein Cantr_07920 [Candida viswanathii]